MAPSSKPTEPPIYLDHQATTPVDPRVLEAMLPYFSEHFGNAASRTHSFGWRAEAAVELAREQIAAALGATSAEQVVFTSGATESNNLAILGIAFANEKRGRHLIGVATEHTSVLDPLAELARRGFEVTLLPVDPKGLVAPQTLRDALREDTILITAMAANNEIGVLQPIAELATIARDAAVPFHTDAAQAATKVPFDLAALPVDLVSLSGHKCYGPKGVGALFVRSRRVRPAPLFHGGGHETGLRPGTLPVPLIVGMGKAFELGVSLREREAATLAQLRDRLWSQLRSGLGALGAEIELNGHAKCRLPGNLNVRVRGLDATLLVSELRDVALSVGSACSSAKAAPSHVLKALGLPDDAIQASFRIGLGRDNQSAQIDRAASRIVEEIALLRQAARAGTLKGRPDLASPAGNLE